MPGATVLELGTGHLMVVSVAVPGAPPENAGVLLVDPASDRAYVRFRRDLSTLSEEDADYLEALADDLASKASEFGGSGLLSWLEENASNFIQVTDRETVPVDSFDKALGRLYKRHVEPKVLPFRTHIPLYSAQAAAGRWGPAMEVETEPEEWIEAPEDVRLTTDMFAAHVTGRSMEPRIPAGSVCLFRGGEALAGSRQGRLVLVMNYGEPGENRFTIKRYRSIKRRNPDGTWEHDRIILEPLNPEYEPWELDESDRILVIGEFLRVLD
jgi:phage repressor protein C with HTH and peptisase S24 domain